MVGLAVGAALVWFWNASSSQDAGEGVADAGEGVADAGSGGVVDALESTYYNIVGFDMTNNNLQAFLALIRQAEGTAGPNGYRTLFGGKLFDSFADHPRIRVSARLGGRRITSTAAGAYQILAGTWDEVKARKGLPDFSPESQDICAVELIRRHGALADVRAGRLLVALEKCNKEWASLPGSPYGQPTISEGRAQQIFADQGGNEVTNA